VQQEKKRPIDFSAADDDSIDSHEISQGDATLVVGMEEDDFPFPQYREAGRRFSVRQGTTAISVSASMDQFTENDQPHEEVDPNFLRPEMPEAMSLDFLASPIELEKAQLERVRLGDGKRGSGLVMAEQLDDLERSKFGLRGKRCEINGSYATAVTSRDTPDLTARAHTSHGSKDSCYKAGGGQFGCTSHPIHSDFASRFQHYCPQTCPTAAPTTKIACAQTRISRRVERGL